MSLDSQVVRTVGLTNVGNTCFANATMQALLSSDLLNGAIITFLNDNYDKEKSDIQKYLIDYCKIMLQMIEKKDDAIDTTDMMRNFWTKPAMVGKQDDAYKFARLLTESFYISTSKKEWKSKKEWASLKKIFNGSLKTKFICDICKHERYSDSQHAFPNLFLSLPKKMLV